MARGLVLESNGAGAPDLAAACTAVVEERMGETARYRLRMPVDVRDGDIPALLDPRLEPGVKMSVFSDDGAAGVTCLVTGEVDRQSIALVRGGEGSEVVVSGGDTTAAMDQEVKVTVWEGMLTTDSMIVTSILTGYGLVPAVDPTLATRPPTRHAMVQRRSDYDFIRMLARRNGCAFWIRPMAAAVGPVVETAHFAAPSFQTLDLPGLIINQRRGNTIRRLDIEFDTSGPTTVKADQVDLTTASAFNADADLSGMESLGTTPVDRIGKGGRSHRLTAPADTAADLLPKASAVLGEAQFFLRAYCTTTVAKLGRVVRAHDTVKVVGAGSRHSGRYYVSAVTHHIDAHRHRMELELVRNAWGEEPGLGAIL